MSEESTVALDRDENPDPVPPEQVACDACGEYSDKLEEVESNTPVSGDLCSDCAPMYRSLFAAQEQDRCISCGADESMFYVEIEVNSWPYHLSGRLCRDCMSDCHVFAFLETFDERAEKVEGYDAE